MLVQRAGNNVWEWEAIRLDLEKKLIPPLALFLWDHPRAACVNDRHDLSEAFERARESSAESWDSFEQ